MAGGKWEPGDYAVFDEGDGRYVVKEYGTDPALSFDDALRFDRFVWQTVRVFAWLTEARRMVDDHERWEGDILDYLAGRRDGAPPDDLIG